MSFVFDAARRAPGRRGDSATLTAFPCLFSYRRGTNGIGAWGAIFNFTADAHPIHLHLVRFRVLDRQTLVRDADGMSVQPAQLVPGTRRPPEAAETGFKDTAVSYPGEVLRLQARFDTAGLFVWHCHILEHEDNEMMRPFCVGDQASCPLPIAAPLL